MIKQEGQKIVAQILSKNQQPLDKSVTLAQLPKAAQQPAAQIPSSVVALQTIKVEVTVHDVMGPQPKRALLAQLPSLNTRAIPHTVGERFHATITPVIDPKSPAIPSSNIGTVIKALPGNQVIIETNNIQYITILPVKLPTGSQLAIQIEEPITPRGTVSRPSELHTVIVKQTLPLLSRINMHWSELSAILRNIVSPNIGNLHKRCTNLFSTGSSQDVLQRLRDIASGHKGSSVNHHTLKKKTILLQSLAKEFAKVMEQTHPARPLVEIQNNLWNHVQFPFFYEGKLKHIPIYVRRDKKQRCLHFILEPEFGNLGRVQLDGLVYLSSVVHDITNAEIRGLHITIRSMADLDSHVQESIRDIIEMHSHAAGIKSELTFSVAHYFPIDAPETL